MTHTKDEALKQATDGLEKILYAFEKDGKFVMKSMIRNELFDEVNLLLVQAKKVLAKPVQPADLHNRLADLHLYEEIAEHYAQCAISPEALRDWVAERVNTPPLPVQEPSYAGVRMWVGDRHVMQVLTKLEFNRAVIEPQRLLELVAERCIKEVTHD